MGNYPARGCAAKPRVDRRRSVNPGNATGCGANPERVLQNANSKRTGHRTQVRLPERENAQIAGLVRWDVLHNPFGVDGFHVTPTQGCPTESGTPGLRCTTPSA